MPDGNRHAAPDFLNPLKFQDPIRTVDGSPRATVELAGLRTLWFNTGTLCNIECRDCYIESSPRNDRLAYLTIEDVRSYLEEISSDGLPVEQIGFTGGEPFMNPDIIEMLELSLAAGHRSLVLTNAMKPLHQKKAPLLELRNKYPDELTVRISIDYPSQDGHEELRGPGSWAAMREGITWLARGGFCIDVAGRTRSGESEDQLRSLYADLFERWEIELDAADPVALVLFPEMDARLDVPEITTACWNILGVSPDAMMCATSRMIVRRKSAPKPSVVACTLLPYDQQFELGSTLADAAGTVSLNHPHCARFCVLGGGACSVAEP